MRRADIRQKLHEERAAIRNPKRTRKNQLARAAAPVALKRRKVFGL
jgi:hypothetical protein